MAACKRCCCWPSPQDSGNPEWLAALSNAPQDVQGAFIVTSSEATESNGSEGDPPAGANLPLTAKNRKKNMQENWTANPTTWKSTEGIQFSRLSASFEQHPKYSKELEDVPAKIEPCGELVATLRLEGVDIQSIHDFFSQDEESPLLATASHFGAFQFWATTWSNGTSGKRRISFMARPRDNAHSSVVRMWGPETTQVIMWVQMDSSEDSVRILQTSSTPNVTYGRDFFVDEYLVFAKQPNGGIKFEFHTHVRWITTYSSLNLKFWNAKPIIDKEPVQAGKKSADFLARHLQALKKPQAQQPQIPERTLARFLSFGEQTSQAGKDAKIKNCLERVVIAEQELTVAKRLLLSMREGDTDELSDAIE